MEMEAISSEAIEWLAARGITAETAAEVGLTSKGNWLRVPFYENGLVVNHKARHLREKRHMMEPGKPLTLFNHDVLLPGQWAKDEPVIITEGEWDAIACMQAGRKRVTSVPNGAPQSPTENIWEAKRYEWVQRHENRLAAVQSFILATDGDEPGRLLAQELAGLLGVERCSFIEYPAGCKDLNEVLLLGGEDGVREVLDGAKPYPVKGLYQFSDYPPPPQVVKIESNLGGVSGVWPLVPGTLSIITGWSGIGKTSMLAWIMADYLKQGVRMAVGSFETDVYILRNKMRSVLLGVPFTDPAVSKRTSYDDMLNDQMLIISQHCGDEESEMDLAYLLELGRVAVLRYGIKLLIIDPWNEIEHKHDRSENEHEYTGRAIRMIKRFARRYNCAVWLVAHPKKPDNVGSEKPKPPGLYSISGSAHFANKADYGITIDRPDRTVPLSHLSVTKVRLGLPGQVGTSILGYNEWSSSYALETDSVISN